jgi:methyl-accepting chemotaxis protein
MLSSSSTSLYYSSIPDNTNSRSSDEISTIDPSTQKTIYTIRNVASNIRQASVRIRDIVRAVRQSGAIDELTTAIHEAVIAARDTTKEINETAKELKECGVIKDTAVNLEKTVVAAREIGETVKDTTQQIEESAPVTSDTLKEAVKVKAKKSHN